MSRVIQVRDSRTILVETSGAIATVRLRDVNVPPIDEPVATNYLRRALAKTWVYIEDGEVYRSPDGLYINGAMKSRAWFGATYLGELDLGPPERKKPSPPPKRVERRSPAAASSKLKKP